jgi:hypothetical protein
VEVHATPPRVRARAKLLRADDIMLSKKWKE